MGYAGFRITIGQCFNPETGRYDGDYRCRISQGYRLLASALSRESADLAMRDARAGLRRTRQARRQP